jgi:hypothetical protein
MQQIITPIVTPIVVPSGSCGSSTIPNSYVAVGIAVLALLLISTLGFSFFTLREDYKDDHLETETLFLYPLFAILGSMIGAVMWPITVTVALFIGAFFYFKPKKRKEKYVPTYDRIFNTERLDD